MVAESSFPLTLHGNRNERSSDFRFGVGMTSLVDARNLSESIEPIRV
jgi:hypothetical protein